MSFIILYPMNVERELEQWESEMFKASFQAWKAGNYEWG